MRGKRGAVMAGFWVLKNMPLLRTLFFWLSRFGELVSEWEPSL
jgi:hypothetical protein